MKPRYLFMVNITNDLTELKLHMVDGRLVVLKPKTYAPWIGGDGKPMTTTSEVPHADGKPREFKIYRVTEYEVIDLKDFLAGGAPTDA